jgi:hypothetical protein
MKMKARHTALFLGAISVSMVIGTRAFAGPDVLFDFNSLTAGKKAGAGSEAVGSYMENLYGSDVSLDSGPQTSKKGVKTSSKWTHLGNSEGASARHPMTRAERKRAQSDTFLFSRSQSKRAAPRIAIQFEKEPITSLKFDFEIFRGGKKTPTGMIVRADGVTVFQYSLLGTQAKVGYLGLEGPIFFDAPVHTLEFIGMPGSGIGIDNLAVNLPAPQSSGADSSGNGGSTPSVTPDIPADPPSNPDSYSHPPSSYGSSSVGTDADIRALPEPSSLLLVGAGLIGLALRKFLRLRR